MSRINEKVKDLIEVRPYKSLQDFGADPSKTLEGYHFTDITAELMASWLDALVDLRVHGGNTKALAGYRGVGKSHFLAAFAAIVSHPEFRSTIHQSHVASSAHHLMRRRYPIAFVRRGTKPTLREELLEAFAQALERPTSEFPEEVGEMITYADGIHSDIPLLIIVDTAYGREKRVARDDGGVLGEIAAAVKDKNIFVAVALDDDITGADGINSAIATSYSIDYLDQEHLYRIVDAHIFPKHRQTQPIIKDIYSDLRKTLPSFRWSEQRFLSLYPLHPSILEIAPFIRLYAPDFALLGFASEAGVRIMGRPANSLIALDEVFDKVEATLRKAPDLEKAFETYDAIQKDVISLVPVMQRLQAKLILKALFVLSLDGDGTSADEIAAAMLIYDESDPAKSAAAVLELLETFISMFPDDLHRKEENGEIRFSFKVAGKDDLNSALAESVGNVSDAVVPRILSKIAKEKFLDWNFSLEDGNEAVHKTDCHIVWRGGQRKGRITWQWGIDSSDTTQNEGVDVEIVITDPSDQTLEFGTPGFGFDWKPAMLSADEIDTMKRYHLLLTDEELSEKYQEQVRAAGHTHSNNIAKIWHRVFVSEAVFTSNGSEYRFGESVPESDSIGELLAAVLTDSLDERFPLHPFFEKTLELKHVSSLVNDLFSGARTTNPEVQELARLYAEPLGLVAKQDQNYVLRKEDEVYGLPVVQRIFELLPESGEMTLSLGEIYEAIRGTDFGLTREAQQLLLGALVAHRKIEFVTNKGDRINRRSLDLKIIWDDIAGVAKPADVSYTAARLCEWAKNITRLEDVDSIDTAEDRLRIKEGLEQWLADWDEANIVSRFADLSDEIINTKTWHVSVGVERAFTGVADAIRSFTEDAISLEQSLQRVADSFTDSDSEFRARENDLVALISFIKNASLRETIWGYLSICEITRDEAVEDMRRRLLELMNQGQSAPTASKNKDVATLWKEFQTAYSDYFAVKHDSIMKSHQLQEEFDEFTKSDSWWEFETLSSIRVFQDVHWHEAQRILAQLRELDCSFDVRENLKTHPFCGCSFNLSKMSEWEELPDRLEMLVEGARASYHKTLEFLKPELLKRLEKFVKNESDPNFEKAASKIAKKLNKNEGAELFSTDELIVLKRVLSTDTMSLMINTEIPSSKGIQSADSLRAGIGQWLDTLPADPVLVKID